MVLKVLSRAQYLTAPVGSMRKADYDATHLVKAAKGLELHPNAYTWARIDGHQVRVSEGSKDRGMDWFAEWAASRLAELLSGTIVLVPIPSSKTTPASPADFRTALLSDRIALRRPNTIVAPVLRFRKERPNSREGGSRLATELYQDMVLTGPLPAGRVVLVDDVVTGGGHLKASAWTLEDAGRSVEIALACGRTTDVQIDDPFAVPEESVELSRGA